MKKYIHFGSLAVVGAAILWSLDGLLRRQLFDLPPTIVVFWEHLFGFVIILPILLFSIKEFKKLTRRQWLSIAVVSLLSGAVGTIFYTAALGKVQYIPYSVVVLLQQLQPLFAITAAAIFLKEKIDKQFIVVAIIALISAYFVSFPDLTVNLSTGDGTAMGALLAVGAAAAWGISTALSKYTLKGTSSFHVTGIRFAFTPIFALLLAVAMGDMESFVVLSSEQWMYVIAITFSTGLVALMLYYYGLKQIPASRSTILELTWPISAVVTGFLFLDERLTTTQWIGAVVLVASMYMVVRNMSEKEKQEIVSEQ